MRSAIALAALYGTAAAAVARTAVMGFDSSWTAISLTVCAACIAWALLDAPVGGRLTRAATCSAALAWVALVAWGSPRWLAGRGTVGVATPVLEWIFRGAGLPAEASGGRVFVTFHDEVVRVAADAFDLGVPALAAMLAAVVVHALCAGRPRVSVAGALTAALATSLALCLRHVVAVAVVASTSGYFAARGPAANIEQELSGWSSALLVVALIPLAPLFRARPGAAAGRTWPSAPRLAAAVALAGSVTAAAAVALEVEARAGQRAGRILVDEAHVGDWEIGGARFEPAWRGDMSVYGFSSAAEFLGKRFDVRFHRFGSLDDSVLRNVDVLILKVPDRPYARDEIAAIHRFVRSGGGLLAVGDHTDLFGCNTSLNEVTGPMGIRLTSTAVSGPSADQASNTMGWGRDWLERGAERMWWLTGCALEVSWGARTLLASSFAVADDGVFANNSFFGDGVLEPSESCGPTVLAAEADYGAGRAIVVGDGTVFTNFAVHIFGRYELLERAVAALNRTSWCPIAVPRLVLLAALVAAGLFAVAVPAGAPRAASIFAAAIGLWCGGVASDAWLAVPRPPPRPAIVERRVAFLGSRANYCLAETIGSSSRPLDESYDTLFVETCRHGFRPTFEPDLSAALASDVVVIPNVLPSFTGAELERLHDWTTDGGVLWVLSSRVPGTEAGVAVIAARFGVPPADASEAAADLCALAEPGEPAGAGRTTFWRVGNGLLGITTGGDALSRQGLGHPFPVPSGENLRRFELLGRVFALLRAHTALTDDQRFGGRAF